MRAAMPHTEGFLDRDGVKLHYEIYGQGEHTILFVPTWTFIHSRGYKAQIPYFAEHFRCITWDPRGNGKSDRPTDPDQYGTGHYVADVLAMMDATDTKSAILVGFSLSGPICTILASYYPDRVKAAIVIGTNSGLVPGHDHRKPGEFENTFENPTGWQKMNRGHWKDNFSDFAEFFAGQVHKEPHSTKQLEDAISWSGQTNGEIMTAEWDGRFDGNYPLEAKHYQRISCPMLVVHGRHDAQQPVIQSETVAKLTGGELVVFEQAAHAPHARFSGQFNILMRDFLAKHLGTWSPAMENEKRTRRRATKSTKRALYLSSPIGLGHARRDLAITRELRALHPDLQVDWLAQDPVTRFLEANNETIHPDSARLANESEHIEDESGEHDLNAFQAIRNMDEILAKNFMVFQDAVESDDYDLIIADEAWDVDHYWHEHPDLKKAPMAWLTDFVGWVPIPDNGAREAFLTSDYNAEMITHVEDHPNLRDRSIFVGNPSDIIPHNFGTDLPEMREWVPKHFDFCGYILGQHPNGFGERAELREKFGYQDGEKVCIVTVGGSGVGGNLIRRILAAYPMAKAAIPELRMVVVTGPRLDPAGFKFPNGVEVRRFVPDLDRHLAACDLALVQGGLTTSMELAAAGTPFLYFPLKNHFEQNFHVAFRLDQYNAGRKMIYEQSDPDHIAQAMVEELAHPKVFKPVESNGAARAATMLSELL
jgi:pimeloyl-ACP methyl ester carboxylesterase/predicted glycosyltransferase